MKKRNDSFMSQEGFSLIEVLVVLTVLSIISAAIFQQIATVQERAATEQVKVDNFDEARDFIDQFFRDINQIGYPNSRMVDTTSTSWSPSLRLQTTTYPWSNTYIFDNRLAVGLVKIDINEIRFEGDTNGDGNVESIIYKVNGSGTCTACLQRSQADKISADPLLGQTQNWGTEVNDVVNTTIFTYFKTDGTQVTGLPLDISTSAGAQTLASVKTIQISLILRNNNVMDPKTHQPIETTFQGEVSLNNCSMAANGQSMSCQ
jgi:prepilin-type N-terminal cleavage/methylation domain-containing protein